MARLRAQCIAGEAEIRAVQARLGGSVKRTVLELGRNPRRARKTAVRRFWRGKGDRAMRGLPCFFEKIVDNLDGERPAVFADLRGNHAAWAEETAAGPLPRWVAGYGLFSAAKGNWSAYRPCIVDSRIPAKRLPTMHVERMDAAGSQVPGAGDRTIGPAGDPGSAIAGTRSGKEGREHRRWTPRMEPFPTGWRRLRSTDEKGSQWARRQGLNFRGVPVDGANNGCAPALLLEARRLHSQ